LWGELRHRPIGQATGGIPWGVGETVLEKSETDPLLGRFLNRNYSEYLVPTNAGIPALATSSLVNSKRKRIRDLPITVEKLL
jgi:CO/xanthine dehydrogenase Mo-binding subunit